MILLRSFHRRIMHSFSSSPERLAMHFMPAIPLDLFASSSYISRQQIPSHTKHLPTNRRTEAIHLSRILLHLPAHKKRLQPTRLDRQLEKLLPLILIQRRLLARNPRRILRLPLRLPGCDLLLLAPERALPVLEVVLFCLMALDTVQEEIAGLFEEGVEAEIEGVEVWGQGVGGCAWVVVDVCE